MPSKLESQITGFLLAAVAAIAVAVPSIASKYVYLPGGKGNPYVSQFRVGADGRKHSLFPARVPAHGSVYSVAVAPNAKAVYALEGDYFGVAQFRVGKSGALTRMPRFEIAAGAHPTSIAFSPNGRFAYVSCSHGDIYAYRIERDGQLSASFPNSVSIASSGFRDPSPVLVSQDERLASVSATKTNGNDEKTISMSFLFQVGKDGRLAPMR